MPTPSGNNTLTPAEFFAQHPELNQQISPQANSILQLATPGNIGIAAGGVGSTLLLSKLLDDAKLLHLRNLAKKGVDVTKMLAPATGTKLKYAVIGGLAALLGEYGYDKLTNKNTNGYYY